MTKQNPLVKRALAVEATRQHYEGKVFQWGTVDCIRLAEFHAEQMGHKTPKRPRYHSALSAKRALAKVSDGTVQGLLSDLFEEIPPAMCLVGDLATMQGEHDMDGVVICIGQKFIGFHEDGRGVVTMIPKDIKKAYRL